jgi:hypothetical protein
MEMVRLQPRQVMHEAGETIRSGYFLNDGLVSVLMVQPTASRTPPWLALAQGGPIDEVIDIVKSHLKQPLLQCPASRVMRLCLESVFSQAATPVRQDEVSWQSLRKTWRDARGL